MPAWISATHFLNIVFGTLLVRSGLEILSSFPSLYWNDHCEPGREWLRLTRRPRPPGPDRMTLEEEESLSPWVALPGGRQLGLGRHWHFAAVIGWVGTGLVYVVLLAATAEWRRLVPTSFDVLPGAWEAALTYLSLDLPPKGDPYNPLQQLSYFGVVFVVGPLTIATGAAMSPALNGRFPRYLKLFGGKQGARTIHFLCLAGFALFTLVHTAAVVAHGLPNGLALVVLGSEERSHRAALAVAGAALLALFLANVALTVVTARRPRPVRRILGAMLDPLQRAGARLLVSRQAYGAGDLSPSLRVNGRPPTGEEYRRLAERGFVDWRLRVHGLVERDLELGLDELRELARRSQITKHNCIQGWTGVAEWTGVPLGVVLDRCGVSPDARYVAVHAYDDKAETAVGAEPRVGRYYEAIPLYLARQPQTILAYELNGTPLPIRHGAPLRLRVENQLGFKMVKWIESIELVAELGAVGLGCGGWKEDHVHFANVVSI